MPSCQGISGVLFRGTACMTGIMLAPQRRARAHTHTLIHPLQGRLKEVRSLTEGHTAENWNLRPPSLVSTLAVKFIHKSKDFGRFGERGNTVEGALLPVLWGAGPRG